jgi:hypothetical protein
MKRLQTYEIKLIFDADVEDGDPKDWLPEALEEGNFKYKTNKIFGTEITPLDIESPENKWIKDSISDSTG